MLTRPPHQSAALNRAYAQVKRRTLQRLADAFPEVYRALWAIEFEEVKKDPRYAEALATVSPRGARGRNRLPKD
jgi:hypothetical protein